MGNCHVQGCPIERGIEATILATSELVALQQVYKSAYELLLCDSKHRDECKCTFCEYLLALSKAVEVHYNLTVQS